MSLADPWLIFPFIFFAFLSFFHRLSFPSFVIFYLMSPPVSGSTNSSSSSYAAVLPIQLLLQYWVRWKAHIFLGYFFFPNSYQLAFRHTYFSILSVPILPNPDASPFLNVHVSHPDNTNGLIAVLYTRTFSFFDIILFGNSLLCALIHLSFANNLASTSSLITVFFKCP